jgi:hypothetical protein
MKYLIIILFLFSCTQVDRVGDEKVYVHKDEPAETTNGLEEATDVKLGGELTEKITVDKPKTVGYEYVDCGRAKGFWSQECVKRVNILTPNKFGIKYIWIGYTEYQDSDVLSADWSISTRIWVKTDRDQDDVDFFYEDGIDIDDLAEEREAIIKKTDKKMQKYIKKALSKPLENE